MPAAKGRLVGVFAGLHRLEHGANGEVPPCPVSRLISGPRCLDDAVRCHLGNGIKEMAMRFPACGGSVSPAMGHACAVHLGNAGTDGEMQPTAMRLGLAIPDELIAIRCVDVGQRLVELFNADVIGLHGTPLFDGYYDGK